MKRRKIKRQKNRTDLFRGFATIAFLIIIVIFGSVMMVGGLLPKTPETADPGKEATTYSIVTPIPQKTKSLQLNSFSFAPQVSQPVITIVPTTQTPAPTQPSVNNYCPHNNAQTISDPSCICGDYKVECSMNKCVRVEVGLALTSRGVEPTSGCTPFLDNACANPSVAGDGNGIYCIAKPIIYLYPQEVMEIDVRVDTPGKIVVSDPLYPEPSGWENIEAHPDGTLFYESIQYRELFYESEVTDFIKPKNGIILANSEIETKLPDILYNLGLNDWESKEFTDFWIPVLRELNSNYILFSIIERSVKNKIDYVIITPEPDTRIEFIAYFKPLDVLQLVEPLILPQRPVRKGFTMVEWGGTIDKGGANFSLK